MRKIEAYLKKHTEALVKDVGFTIACEITGKSKTTLGRYYSDNADHADRFMPLDTIAQLESTAGFPHVTSALADLKNIKISYSRCTLSGSRDGCLHLDVVALSRRFALLIAEYQKSVEDGVITVNEAKRLLKEICLLQQILVEMKLKLEGECVE